MILDPLTIQILLLLAAMHYLGDFILQSGKMAQGKSSSNLWLTYHVVTYTAVLYLMTAGHWIFALTNGVLHWLTDWVTSRINSRLWAAKRVHGFFVGVGADQLVHAVTLAGTAYWLLA